MPRDLPPSAVSIYYQNDLIWVQFTLPNSGKVSEVSFQNTPQGLAALSRFLMERERAFACHRPAHFATAAAPIQHIVNSWQRDPQAEAKAAKAKARAEAERFKSKPIQEQLSDLESLFESPNFDL
jgi:hypothetical protein